MAKAAEASPRREGRARRETRKGQAGLTVNAGTARRRDTKKAECRKMKSDIAAGKCDKSGKPTGVNWLAATGTTQPSPQASHAPSLESTIPLQQMVPVPTETRFINMIVLAMRTLMVASLELLDSGSGSTSCPINFADDIPLLPRLANLLTLSDATGGGVECIGQRQVGYRLENGEPIVATWHVANVTNLTISTESLTPANIEVRHAKNESSLILDRCGTRTSVILHKFAKVLWLKRRGNNILDSDLRIAAVNMKPMVIEEIDSDEERQPRLRRKKEMLGMDNALEVHRTHGSESSAAQGSRDPTRQPVEASIAQRTALDLVLWSDESGGLLEPAQEEQKPEARASQLVRIPRRRPRMSLHTQASETGAVIACKEEPPTIHITDNHTESQSSRSSWPTTASCRTHLTVSCSQSWICWRRCSRHDGGNQCGGKGVSNIRSLGGGRTLTSLGMEESDIPYRWPTSNSSTGRCDSTRHERRNRHRMSTKVFLTINGSG